MSTRSALLVLLALALVAAVFFYAGCARRDAGRSSSAGPVPAPGEAPGRPAPSSSPVPFPTAGPFNEVFTPRMPFFRAEGLRLAALNAEFLFDGEEPDGQATFDWKGDPAAARAHRDAIAQVIRLTGADVIMLAEVENREVAEAMVRESLSDLGYRVYFERGTDSFTGQDMALLSRVPVEAFGRTDERARVGTTRLEYGVSKNLWARLDLGGVPVTVIGVHFLARPDDLERKPRREAQAEVIRRLVEREAALGRAVAVVGDLNDFDPDVADRAGSRPVTDVLRTIKAAGPGDEDDLRNVLAEVPAADRFTAFYDRNRNGTFEEGEFSAIDHVLLSPRLYRAVREVTVVHAYDPRAVTDHFPIVVTLGL